MAKIAETYIIKSPDQLSSLNDIWGTTIALGLSSSDLNVINIGSTNFSYWTQIVAYDAIDEETNLGIFKYPPRPNDGSNLPPGYGAFSVNNPLRSFFQTDVENFSTTHSVVSNNGLKPNYWSTLINYSINSGFSFNPNLSCVGFEFIDGANSFLGFSFSASASQSFFVGDSNFYVVSSNQFIQGGHIVNTSFGTSYSVVTTTAFTEAMASGSPNATITDYSQGDAANTLFEGYGFDGTIDYHLYQYGYDFLITNGTISNYIDNTTFKFLCNYPNRQDSFSCSEAPSGPCFPNPKRTRVNQYETINLVIDSTLFDPNEVYVYYDTYDSSWNALDQIQVDLSTFVGCTSCGLFRMDIPIGYNNISYLMASPDSVEYVVMWVGYGAVEPLTEYRGFYYDRQCTIYSDKHFMFINKLGGWDYWTFYQDTKETHSISRNEFKKEVPWGEFQNRGWGWRGKTVMSGQVNKTFTANTNWITETEYEYLAELIESPEVYVMEYYAQYNDYKPVPIIVTDTSYEIKSSKREQIFNLTMNYKYSINTPLQRQ
jgi:hypothetical protein